MIRPAQLRDLPQLWSMVQGYAQEMGPEGFAPNKSVTLTTLQGLMSSPQGAVFVTAGQDGLRGMLAGGLTRSPWVHGYVADMLILYVNPAHRGGRDAVQLIRAFERFAEAGCAKVVGLSDSGDMLGRMALRMGYARSDVKYMRPV